ncbi:MAG: YqjK-like family protein [Methanomicrobiales archaeon]|nr:YqjK-like family protein [Methanomicrobiales archaeon]
MNERLLELRQRRGELLERIDAQRAQLAEIASIWEQPLAIADRGMSVVRFLRDHLPIVVGVAALVVARRRGLRGLLKRALRVWRTFRFFLGLRPGL